MIVTAPAILLHGWGGSAQTTFAANGWIDALRAAGVEVEAWDLPGHARDGASHDPGAYGDLAGEVLEDLPDRACDLVGYSLGAKIALEIAARAPARVRRLVAIGVGDNAFAPEAAGDAVIQALEGGVLPAPGVARGLVLYSRASGADPLALAAVLRRSPNPVATEARLRPVGGRTLLINGDADRLAQPDDRLRATLPGHTYVRLSDVDHFALPADPAVRGTVATYLTAAEALFDEDAARERA